MIGITPKTIIIMLATFLSQAASGQENSKNLNSIFIEIAGSGGIGSINYESQIYQKNTIALTWRVGLSLAPIDKNNGTAIIFPVMINTLIGNSAHKLELGLGQGFTITTKGNPFALTIAALGYRYQPANKNWFYRITYTPLVSYLVDFQIQQWGGLSLGYNL